MSPAEGSQLSVHSRVQPLSWTTGPQRTLPPSQSDGSSGWYLSLSGTHLAGLTPDPSAVRGVGGAVGMGDREKALRHKVRGKNVGLGAGLGFRGCLCVRSVHPGGPQPPPPTAAPSSGANRLFFLTLNLSFQALSVPFWMKKSRHFGLINLFIKVPALWSHKSSIVGKCHCVFCRYIKIFPAFPPPPPPMVLHPWVVHRVWMRLSGSYLVSG